MFAGVIPTAAHGHASAGEITAQKKFRSQRAWFLTFQHTPCGAESGECMMGDEAHTKRCANGIYFFHHFHTGKILFHLQLTQLRKHFTDRKKEMQVILN